jgi:peptide/nickel transport system permease protein
VLTYISRRVLYSIPVILIASFLLFFFVRETFNPCTRVRASRDVTALERCEESLHLNEPIFSQYGRWLGGAVTGDLGNSERTDAEVWPMIQKALWYTVQLIFWGILVSTILAIALGVYSAVRQYSIGDYAFTALSYVGLALPPFVFGILAIQLLAVGPTEWFDLQEPWLYFIGFHESGESGFNLDYARHLVLPVMTLTIQIIAEWSRFQRAAMLDVLSADYIRTARAKGVRPTRLIMRHALRNGLIPIITVVGLYFGTLIGNSVLTEIIFNRPGLGKLILGALNARDYTLLQGLMIIFAFCVIVVNTLTDLAYGLVDPRVKYK